MSTFDFIAIASFVLAVQALFGTMAFGYVKRELRRDGETRRMAERTRREVAYSSGAVIELARRLQVHAEFQAGLSRRFLEKVRSTDQLPAFREQLIKTRDETSKVAAELMLISREKTLRESAYRNLSMRLGDQGTLKRMAEVSVFADEDQELTKAIKRLEHRLSTTGK